MLQILLNLGGELIFLKRMSERLTERRKYGWKPKLNSFKGGTFMSTLRRPLTEAAYKHTFGCIAKAKRRELNQEKSHHNHAFVMAGSTTQSRCEPLMMAIKKRGGICKITG